MSKSEIQLLVLDAHGVVLNNYFPKFLDKLAIQLGMSNEKMHQHWEQKLRTPAWLGELDEEALWLQLTKGQCGPPRWDMLEAGYQLGPAAPHLARWAEKVPIWILSNHRSHWLVPRLQRFGIHNFVSRVFISDAIGAAKPNPRAFALLDSERIRHESILFVDDQARNVSVAHTLGFQAIHAVAGSEWIDDIDTLLEIGNSEPMRVGLSEGNEETCS